MVCYRLGQVKSRLINQTQLIGGCFGQSTAISLLFIQITLKPFALVGQYGMVNRYCSNKQGFLHQSHISLQVNKTKEIQHVMLQRMLFILLTFHCVCKKHYRGFNSTSHPFSNVKQLIANHGSQMPIASLFLFTPSSYSCA